MQIFDSWAGVLPAGEYGRWCLSPIRQIVAGLRARHSRAKVIGFPKGIGPRLNDFAALTGVDALGLDSAVDPLWAAQHLASARVLQGNLDPTGAARWRRRARGRCARILKASVGRPTSSISAMASCSRRRSPMLRLSSGWCGNAARHERILSLDQGRAYYRGHRLDGRPALFAEALLSVLYPHYLRPIPSMSIVEFHMDYEQVSPEKGLKLDGGALLRSRPVNGVPCKFRTCYDVTFWPVDIAEAEWKTPDRLAPAVRSSEAAYALRLDLRCFGDVTFSKLALDSLRFYLNGESNLVHSLYEVLCNNLVQILVRDPNPKSKIPPVVLPAGSLRPVGFAENEGMLPYPRRSFIGYGLLQEYFCFPQKFFFLDLAGLDRVRAAGFGGRVEAILLLSPFERADRRQMLELGVSAKTFRLNCAPIVNLFPQTAEPILLSHARFDYPVVPDVNRRTSMEVFQINDVVSAARGRAGGHPVRALLLFPARPHAHQGAGFLARQAPPLRVPRRRRHRGPALAGGPVRQAGPARSGYAHGAHPLLQPRPSLAAALRQRERRFRTGWRRRGEEHRGAHQTHRHASRSRQQGLALAPDLASLAELPVPG